MQAVVACDWGRRYLYAMTEQRQRTRIDLAIDQLDVALELFLDKRSYAAALTLAGAAEEILGRALNLRKQANSLDEWHDRIAEVWGTSRKDFVKKINEARNAAKHLASSDELEIGFDVQTEAVWLLVRACDNYERLGYERTDRMWNFTEWFHGEFIGV